MCGGESKAEKEGDVFEVMSVIEGVGPNVRIATKECVS